MKCSYLFFQVLSVYVSVEGAGGSDYEIRRLFSMQIALNQI